MPSLAPEAATPPAPVAATVAASARRAALASALGLLVTFLAFALRTRNLGTQSFWWDEAYSAVVARGSLREIIAAITAADFHPPLHYVLFHYWRLLAGESEYALRFTAAAAGTATVALGYATAHRFFGRAAGLVAAVLFASSPFLVYYSTEARMFALAALFALLGTYLGHRAVADGRWWPAFGLAVAVGLWNYYYAVFVVVPVGLLALVSLRPRAILGYAGSVALAAMLYAPWLPTMLGRAIDWTSPWTAPTSPRRVVAWTWPELLTGIPAMDLWDEPRLRLDLLAVAGLLGLAIVASLWRAIPAQQRAALLYATAAGLVPLGLMAAVAMVRPIYHPRYAIPAAPGLYLALAGAIALPVRWLLPLRAALAVAVVALFGYGLARYDNGDGLTRDDYRSAVGYVQAHEQPGDVAITNTPPGFDYYYRGAMPHRELPGTPYDDVTIARDLNELSRGHRRIWYLTHALRPSDPEGFVDSELARHAEPIERRDFGQLHLALFDLPDPPNFAPPTPHRLPSLAVGEVLVLTGWGHDDRPELAGSGLPLSLEWRVAAPPPTDYGVWVRLTDSQGFAWGREDRQPRDASFRLSSEWIVGSHVTTGHGVPIAPGTPPGHYQLEVGVYRLDNLAGLDVRDAAGTKIGQSVVLGEVEVARNPRATGDPSLRGPGGPIDGAVTLVGSGLGQKEADAGSSIELTLLWRASAAPGPRERILRLLGGNGTVAAERRGPSGSGQYPADRWAAGDLVREQARLALPPTLAAGTYRVWAGLAPPDGQPVGLEIGVVAVRAIPRSFELPPIAHSLDVDFGDGVRLRGWDVTRLDPGHLRVTLYWQPTGTPTRDYHVFNHLLDADNKIVAQRDGVPANWSRPTTGWVAGEAIQDMYDIELPPSAEPLRLRVGMYEPTGGARLRTPTGDDHVDLGAVS